ncbi:MAG: hypothetical protein ACE5JX_22450 [Acidobacteriota bacterium]
MGKESSLRKVIVRRGDGQVVAGFADSSKIQNSVRIINRQGKEEVFPLDDVKAVFFVKDFDGNPKYEDIHFLKRQTGSPAVWVRVKFSDGETIEGKIENNVNLLAQPGFFLWPSDSETNNDCVYIAKSAVAEFTILSAD